MFSAFLLMSLLAQSSEKNAWETRFEASGYKQTPRYAETMEYFSNFEKNTPYAKMFSIGKSPQGRDIPCLVVSKDKAFTAVSAKKEHKPVVLVINGIHSGEIEGKDACMLLLRDILVDKSQSKLLDHATLLIIPIFSVDAHERFGKFNRINQNGPEEMGWRTTAQNLNLNRDWMKADAPEMQAMLKLVVEWDPDFTVDTHTTDGADYQYTVTYGVEKYGNIYSGTSALLRKEFIPFMEQYVVDRGYYIAPYVGFKGGEPKTGLVDFPGTPRFSTGYAAVRNRIALLVETHMMKPYKDRVFATKAMLEAVLTFVNTNAEKLLALDKEADENSIKSLAQEKHALPVQFKSTDSASKYLYRGLKYSYDSSFVSGTTKTVYSKEPFEEEIPYYNVINAADSIMLPYVYLIPREWTVIIDRIKLHGITLKRTQGEQTLQVTKYKFREVTYAATPYEGRQGVSCKYDSFADTVIVPAGTYVVYPAQKTVRVIAHLLEPKSGDSFLRWGFMNTIFERKEYFEDYVMEKVAAEMLTHDPALKKEFEEKLANDKKFRESPNQRLNFFYERSSYFDKQQSVYPIMRVENNVNITTSDR